MKIAVIGLGYVGLPLSLQFISSGVDVIGLDVDTNKVNSLKEGCSYIKHILNDSIHDAVETGRFEPSTDFSRVSEVEAVIICVPTPLNKHREPDISCVLDTGRAIAPFLGSLRSVPTKKAGSVYAEAPVLEVDSFVFHESGGSGPNGSSNGSRRVGMLDDSEMGSFHEGNGSRADSRMVKLVVLESTTYPGTTDEDLRTVIEEGSGLKAGVGFHLAFSPEREDPGNPMSRVATIPKVIGGFTPVCLERARALYGMAVENLVPVSSCRAAEATKLLENIFRSVNIALVNELKVIYEAMGINVWEVIEAAKTKPFGFMPFYPGPGLGGHCIPIDPFYLTWKAREFGQHTRFIELAGEINAGMPKYVVRKIAEALNGKSLALRGSRVLLIGLAYKADVDDVRESPTFVLMDELKAQGANIAYFDPLVPVIPDTKEHAHWAGVKSIEWDQEAVSSFDCVVICTAHSMIDFATLGQWGREIVDTRNAMAKIGPQGGNVIRA